MIEGRRGVASVIGSVFMVVIFMVAVGTQVYLSGLQTQSAQASQQAQVLIAERSSESLAYANLPSGLSVTNGGTSSVELVAIVLRFENGTFYDLNLASTPQFAGSNIPSSGSTEVQPLIPSGICSPGTATCLSKYHSIVSTAVSGREVGVVTSLGNAFWFVPSGAGPAASGSSYYHTAGAQSTSSPTWVPANGLSFSGLPDSYYVVEFDVAYWQSSTSNPVIAFGITVSPGGSFLFCGGMWWADASSATNDFTPGNECTGTANVSLGATHNTQTTCNNSGAACEWVGTAYVSFGSSGGTFTLEFEGSSLDTASIAADSTIVVTSAG